MKRNYRGNNIFDFAGTSLGVTISLKAKPANPNQYTNNVYVAPDKTSKTESGTALAPARFFEQRT